MKAINILLILLTISIFSCNQEHTKKKKFKKPLQNQETSTENKITHTATEDNSVYVTSNKISEIQTDSLPFIIPDSLLFPEIIYSLTSRNKLNLGCCDYEYAYWFTDKTAKPLIIFGFATDYHRVLEVLLDRNNLDKEMFKRINLERRKDSIIDIYRNGTDEFLYKDTIRKLVRMSPEETVKYIRHLKPENYNILDQKYFVTQQGFHLGMKMDKAIKYYGKPDSLIQLKNIKILYWDFYPYITVRNPRIKGNKIFIDINDNDQYADFIINYKDSTSTYYHKPIVLGKYHFQVYMFFKDKKLTGLVLLDDVP